MKKRFFSRRRGSILDLLLILLFLLALFGGLWRWQSGTVDQGADWRTYRVQARMTGIAPAVADCLQLGESLYLASGEYFGRLEDMQRVPTEVQLLSGGVYYSGAWDPADRCDLIVTVSFRGTENRDGPLREGRHVILRGERLTLYAAAAALELTVQNWQRSD